MLLNPNNRPEVINIHVPEFRTQPHLAPKSVKVTRDGQDVCRGPVLYNATTGMAILNAANFTCFSSVRSIFPYEFKLYDYDIIERGEKTLCHTEDQWAKVVGKLNGNVGINCAPEGMQNNYLIHIGRVLRLRRNIPILTAYFPCWLCGEGWIVRGPTTRRLP